ncbi:MAG: ACP S-malonyltransferase [Desulfovibrionaceae bacterium]|nr:ACP S-malonyltransferase [Desulfovibrionaceae bacterium]
MKKTILLFPGQGSQCKGMGRELAETDSWSMDLWKKAEQVSRLPLREIFWDGDEKDMAETKALQPALTVVNCSLWKILASRVEPIGAAGHSLGEFSALFAAEVLSIEDVLTLTALRGSLMDQADPKHTGGMVAVVKLEVETVLELIEEAKAETGELLVAANFNTPVQTVVSGTNAALAAFMPKVKAKKGRAIALKVSAAFHSPIMDEANSEFAKVLAKASWHRAKFPVYGNVDGCGAVDGDALYEKVKRQMTSGVQWVETVRTQYADGARAWLEIGPKSLLVKMVPACLSCADGIETAAVTDRESCEGIE